jgi:cytosine/uracil/thiamine/allantoin permease
MQMSDVTSITCFYCTHGYKDLLPVVLEHRTWRAYNYVALYVYSSSFIKDACQSVTPWIEQLGSRHVQH